MAELQQELPGLSSFVTLSPIPRMLDWLRAHKAEEAFALLDGTATPEEVRAAALSYLISAKSRDGAPFDPVARFHLGNGAQIHAVHGAADMSETGRRNAAGAMVNYEYDLQQIERNHERFVQLGEISMTPALRAKTLKSDRERRVQAG